MFSFKAPSKKRKRKIQADKEDGKRIVVTNDNDDDGAGESDDSGDTSGHDTMIDQKKKSKKIISKLDVDQGNEDENNDMKHDTRSLERKKSKKLNRMKLSKKKKNIKNTIMSFTLDDDDDDDDDGHKKEKKNKSKNTKKKMKKSRKRNVGFGYGGGGGMMSHLNDKDDDNYDEMMNSKGYGISAFQSSVIHDDDGEENDVGINGNTMTEQNHNDDGNNNNDATSTSSNIYGKEALAKLKAQQKTFVDPDYVSNDNVGSSNKNSAREINDNNNNETTNAKPNNSNQKEDNTYISLPPLPSRIMKPKPPVPVLLPNKRNEYDQDFLAFDNKKSNSPQHNQMSILTGDDALRFTGEYDDAVEVTTTHDGQKIINKANLGTESLSNIPRTQTLNLSMNVNDDDDDENQIDDEVDEGGRKWEEEVARRAGVGRTNNEQTSNQKHKQYPDEKEIPTNEDEGGSSSIIGDVRNTIQSTLENLNQMEGDLDSNIGRRTHDQLMSQEELIKKELELKDIGDRFEYYQSLRMDIINWIGALRYVAERVDLVEKAIIDLYRDIDSKNELKWREWEDEVIATLKNRGMLNYVVGRQPIVEFKEDEVIVDEFGRDRKSLESLARTKRITERRRIRAESQDRRRGREKLISETTSYHEHEFEDSDLDVSDNELMDREERRRVYSDAIGVVLTETDESYTSPTKLLSTFKEWKRHHKDDYDQCYASMTLIELMNVFVKLETCQKFDFVCNGDKYSHDQLQLDSFKWFNALDKPVNDSKEIMLDINSMKCQLVEKNVGDTFLSSFRPLGKGFGRYNPFSNKQTQSLISYFASMCKLTMQDESKLQTSVSKMLLEHVNNIIQNLAMPILNEESLEDSSDNIFMFSVFGQLKRLRKLVINLTKWSVLLTNEVQFEIGKFCLMDVIAYRFLPIFEIAHQVLDQKLASEALNEFKKIIDAVKGNGWLANNDLMLSSAPLRAAAIARSLI
jgi:hypothetical protein